MHLILPLRAWRTDIMEKKLEVKNLKISFKTANGKVQAVRDISFDLYKGETLAIVGESGSGKSVTSKSMLGILAGNAIIEGGELLYDGKDLLKISEDEFYRIRGDKIAMIFQDPMSSLNPIMRIGKQLTEAMILKGKARQKASRKSFNDTLALLNKTMIEAITKGGYEKTVGPLPVAVKSAEELTKMCKDFDSFEVKHAEIELAYNNAREAVIETLENVDDAIFHIEKNAFDKPKDRIRDIKETAKKTSNPYLVSDKFEELNKLSSVLNVKDLNATLDALKGMKAILDEAADKKAPNFFRMGYYLKFSGMPLPNMPVDELDAYLLTYLNDNFMTEFLLYAKVALSYSAAIHNAKKQAVLDVAAKAGTVFESEILNKKETAKYIGSLVEAVENSIDHLEINKDSIAYTFKTAIEAAHKAYFNAIPRNKAAQKAHDKQQKKYDALIKRGKTPDWKVIPAALIDMNDAKNGIVRVIERLVGHYNTRLANAASVDYAKETVSLIDFFKQNASDTVNRVTKAGAKHKAIKLMEEVGIPEPKKRFKQYPFEFSGGMRQRMVIAIALAANPDILICDEPTTALDVTIQAQILEQINKIKEERKLSIIFITHDLGVVANMADRIAVMYAGKIVECGTAEDVFYSPAHPYTWALLSSMPDLDTNERLEAIPGTPPNMIYPPVGDAFAERNKYALEIDYELQPPMFKISDTHSAATWLLHENAPKVDPPKIITDRVARMRARGGENNG